MKGRELLGAVVVCAWMQLACAEMTQEGQFSQTKEFDPYLQEWIEPENSLGYQQRPIYEKAELGATPAAVLAEINKPNSTLPLSMYLPFDEIGLPKSMFPAVPCSSRSGTADNRPSQEEDEPDYDGRGDNDKDEDSGDSGDSRDSKDNRETGNEEEEEEKEKEKNDSVLRDGASDSNRQGPALVPLLPLAATPKEDPQSEPSSVRNSSDNGRSDPDEISHNNHTTVPLNSGQPQETEAPIKCPRPAMRGVRIIMGKPIKLASNHHKAKYRLKKTGNKRGKPLPKTRSILGKMIKLRFFENGRQVDRPPGNVQTKVYYSSP